MSLNDSNSTEDFCTICRDQDSACDFITNCGHEFHQDCLFNPNGVQSRDECPYCRQFITNYRERERFLWNLKKFKTEDEGNCSIYDFYHEFISSDCQSDDIPNYTKVMIADLIKCGWDINENVDGGFNLLAKICENDDLYRFNMLINFGLKIEEDSVFEKEATRIAEYNESVLVLERINELKLNSIDKLLDSEVVNEGVDQLIEACSSNNFSLVIELVDKNVDVNGRDSRGSRPIHKACASANINIVNFLIEKGAELNCVDFNDKSPLHEACTSVLNRNEVVKRLLELEVKVNYIDQDKNTQLHAAIISRKFKIAEMLIDHYENINVLNHFDESPLHLAADIGTKSLVDKLISKGISINAKDKTGRTPLHRAVATNTIDVVDSLLENGANANDLNENNEHAVLIAINRKQCLPFISSLIKYGADLNLKDSLNRTVLELYVSIHP